MAVTQYIGARYVPLLFTNPDDNTNNWKSGVVYDPLTIVTDLNQSYTSKIPVPASVGRPSENPEYWILTGSYNAQINALSQDVDELTQDVEDLTQAVTERNNRKYIFIGDSYNTHDTPAGGVAITPWGEILPTFLNIADDEWYNSGVSGAGFVAGTTFLQQLQTLGAQIENKNEITDIVVAGGVNDGSFLNSLGTAIDTFATYCKNTYPNAMVTLAMISWGKSATGRPIYEQIAYYYQTKSTHTNVRAISNAVNFYHNYTLHQSESEGHPSLAGSRVIAMNLANFLKGGTPGLMNLSAGSATTVTTDLPFASRYFTVKEQLGLDYGSTELASDQDHNIILTLSSGATMQSGNLYKMLYYGPVYNWYLNKQITAPGFVRKSDGTTYYNVMFVINFNEHDISFKIINTSGSSFTKFTDITTIAMYGVPTLMTSLFEC